MAAVDLPAQRQRVGTCAAPERADVQQLLRRGLHLFRHGGLEHDALLL